MGEENNVEVRPDGLVKAKGIPICRRVVKGGVVCLEVTPRAKNSNAARGLGGTPATVTLAEFVQAITEGNDDSQ